MRCSKSALNPNRKVNKKENLLSELTGCKACFGLLNVIQCESTVKILSMCWDAASAEIIRSPVDTPGLATDTFSHFGGVHESKAGFFSLTLCWRFRATLRSVIMSQCPDLLLHRCGRWATSPCWGQPLCGPSPLWSLLEEPSLSGRAWVLGGSQWEVESWSLGSQPPYQQAGPLCGRIGTEDTR